MNKKNILIDVFIFIAILATVFGIRLSRGSKQELAYEPSKVRGNPDANISIIEFSDFACPYCRKMEPLIDEYLQAFPNDLKVIFKHFPLKNHKTAFKAAEAAECAADQGKFPEYSHILFEKVIDWYEWDGVAKDLKTLFSGYAQDLGLNREAFAQCYESGVKKPIVDSNIAEGKDYLVSGTPTFILNGTKVITHMSDKERTMKMLSDLVSKKGS